MLWQEVIDFLESDASVESPSQALMADKHWWAHEYSQEVPREVTGLHLVAYFGLRQDRTIIVELLLDTGKVNADAQNQWGLTPLSWATKQGHEAIVKLLLDTDTVDVNTEDWSGQSPLLWAAQEGHEGIVKLLLDTGKVDLDASGQSGQT
ncbi:ankyrin repeat-containing domain protein [Ilyonectria robusta]|uniref:ankyrin repeat-containing domain protein n=1 Tax=Ilyonectria robusta TaxID=1079257 RepID=UPI001E8DC711|nr:ankyrin repeat-containing domain protein [Ilyonectria robusta]KAH8665516.1 ankyrin repeat-containing domain protein [Ilyonectria robusta]